MEIGGGLQIILVGHNMRSIILQHGTSEYQQLLDLSIPINKAYADKFGFEHLVNNTKRCTDRCVFWEKIAYINEILPTIEDGSLVVWIDGDSLAIGEEDLHNAMPSNSNFGMVQLRGGLGGRQLLTWYNAGFFTMINSPEIRQFFTNVWNRNTPTDEDAINAELKHIDLTINGQYISSLDPKWNCWRNNTVFCSSPVIKSFHGMSLSDKLTQMTDFINQRR